VGLAHRGKLLAPWPTGGWALELQGLYLATAVAFHPPFVVPAVAPRWRARRHRPRENGAAALR
jgi:hypothetical protein